MAMADLIAERRWTGEVTSHRVRLRARDTEVLLLMWVLELLARSWREQRVFARLDVLAVEGGTLEAELQGADVANWRCDPPHVPMPDVSVEQQGDGFSATVRFEGDLRGRRSANRHRIVWMTPWPQ
jgi:SHS2 domain-containing protein